MDIASITPLILTFNESPNIRRTLERLTWAQSVLIVDSFSTDATLDIVREFPNTKILQRPFDHFADQCNFGLQHIQTKWALSLDADYVCPTGLADELTSLNEEFSGYVASFRYCIYGRPVRGTLYPPRTVLYQTAQASYSRDGHAHRVSVQGNKGKLRSVIDHDDFKPLSHWLKSQARYAALESEKLLSHPQSQLGWKDRLRRQIFVAPILTFFYCLFAKMLILDGWPGFYYTLQRVYAELLLSLDLLDRRLYSRQELQTVGQSDSLTADVHPKPISNEKV